MTKHQAADGTSLDLLSLDRGLQDVASRHNAYGRGDLAQRWTRQIYALGYEPPVPEHPLFPATKLPFMRVHNSQNESVSVSPAGYADMGENEWRHKGHDVTVIDPRGDQGTEADQFAWTTSLRFSTPVIVDEIFVTLENTLIGREPYNNNWVYPNPPGGGRRSPATQIGAGGLDWVSDVVVQMQVDSDLARNHAELADLAVNFWDWRADGRIMRNYAGGADTLLPASVNGMVDGLWVQLKELNVPVPAFAGVRFSLILPWYNPAVFDVSGSWGLPAFGAVEPWRRQAYHVAVTVLEPLRVGSVQGPTVAEVVGGGFEAP